ncbi:hypothetical protein BH09ACT8_BH09ACT8_59100 [soil metagenome]
MAALKTRQVGRGELVRQLATMDETEFRDVADEARGYSLVALAELVVEGLGQDIGQLAQRLGDAVVLDDIGRRCVTRETARQLFTEREERLEQQRAEARRQREEFDARRERLRAEKEEQEQAAKKGRQQYTPPPAPDWHAEGAARPFP